MNKFPKFTMSTTRSLLFLVVSLWFLMVGLSAESCKSPYLRPRNHIYYCGWQHARASHEGSLRCD